jgi:hypothetical protein
MARTVSVMVQPGQLALTVMPLFAFSCARTLVGVFAQSGLAEDADVAASGEASMNPASDGSRGMADHSPAWSSSANISSQTSQP